jgi:4-diphosphocytidyl-2-C-methyl-D-erythritol kinase
LPPYWYLLLNPGVPLSTRWVYENLNLEEVRLSPETEDWDPEHPERWVHNDLQTVALKRFPELGTILQQLARLKAWTQGISGSGPTIFALFATLESAQMAARELRRTFSGWMILCRGLTGQATDALWENRTWTI